VKRVSLLWILALGACNADVDMPWDLAHDRIIAVRAEPPRIAPGEQATIDLLVGFEAQPVTERAPDFAMVQSPGSLSDLMTQSGDAWVVTAPSEERLAAARTELGLMPDAPVPLSIGVAAAWPNPVMSPNDAGFGALKTVWLGDTAVNPTLAGLTINGLEVPAGEEIVVAKDTKVPLFVEADDEVQIVNWLTSCGEMHDFDLHSAYLTVGPEDPQEGELAVVVRDPSGGVAWRVWPIRAE
jgi:hypothetical protein